MNLRGVLSFLLSSTIAFGGPHPEPVGESLIRAKLKDGDIRPHLLLAIDGYESARDAYEKRGQDALLEEMPQISKDDREFLRAKVGNLHPLPKVSLEGDNVLVVDAEVRATVASLEKGTTLLVKGQKVFLPLDGSFREAFGLLEPIFSAKKVASRFSLIRSAHAADGALLALGIVAIIAAAFFGGKSYSNYKDQKESEEKDFLPETATEEQVTQYRKKHNLSPDGSRDFGVIGGASRAARNFWSSASTKDKPESKAFYGDGSWGRSIATSLRKLGPNSRMMSQPPDDLLKQCPNFKGLNETEKTQVWVATFDALSMAESGHNTKVAYPETFGVTSRGLLQLSWASARGHKGPCIDATANNLHNPEYNLACGVKVMENQLKARNALFPQNYYYWSVMSPARNPRGFERFSARLNYLKTIAERWPVNCGSATGPRAPVKAAAPK